MYCHIYSSSFHLTCSIILRKDLLLSAFFVFFRLVIHLCSDRKSVTPLVSTFHTLSTNQTNGPWVQFILHWSSIYSLTNAFTCQCCWKDPCHTFPSSTIAVQAIGKLTKRLKTMLQWVNIMIIDKNNNICPSTTTTRIMLIYTIILLYHLKNIIFYHYML